MDRSTIKSLLVRRHFTNAVERDRSLHMLKRIVFFLGALLLAAALADAVEEKPNIVFIFTDDQRYDAMGCAGNSLIQTPHLDSLAKQGVLFSKAFVTLSICSPSRAAVLTGRYGSSTGVTTLGLPLNEGEKTFAHLLKARLRLSCSGCG